MRFPRVPWLLAWAFVPVVCSAIYIGAQNTMSSGAVHPAEYDAVGRPITAGGFVDRGPIVFKDITQAASLGGWRHVMGGPEKTFIIESNGSGVALLDYDNDGWPDIFVANYGKNRLYHNNHDGTFIDVAEKAGVTLGNWSAGASWGDYDGDGKLDLFVSGYVHFDLNKLPYQKSAVMGFADCAYRGIGNLTCGPRGLEGEPDHLFHNNGDGTFTDVSEKAGVADTSKYYGLTAVFADVDGDGKQDLLVANDSTPNYFYRNKGDGTFSDESYMSGFALNKDGREVAGMGIATGDYLNNGRLDLLVTDFADDSKVLYRNDGDASLADVSYRSGIGDSSIPFLSWGAAFIDYDNDGWQDLFIVNGHVFPVADKSDWGSTYAQKPLLFRNVKNGHFEPVPAVKGTGLAVVLSARGAAFGDLFNDGKTDVVMNPIDGPPVLLRNVNDDHNHWVELKLTGDQRSPHDAVGAFAILTINGEKWRRDVLSSGSYISSNDQRMLFGLGSAEDAGSVEIHWPSGSKETVRLPAVDRIYSITEGKGITGSLSGGEPCKEVPPARSQPITQRKSLRH